MDTINGRNTRTIRHFSTLGLALFLFLTPFEYPLADLFTVSPLKIVGLIAMGLAALDVLRQKTLKLDYRVLYVVLWLLYGAVTVIWVANRERFQSFYSIYLNNALMFLLFSMISFSKYEAYFLKKTLILGVWALLFYMLLIPDAAVFSDYQHRLTLNAGKEGLDQNYLAALMLVSFGIVFYDFCNAKREKAKKIVSLLFCVAVVVCIILTGSRSGLIALIAIIVLSINTSWKIRLYIGVPTMLLLVIVFPILMEQLPKELIERFSLSAFTGQTAESGTRLLIWNRALSALKGFKWVFGVGIGASQTVVGNLLGKGYDAVIHNHFIAMLVECGIVGFCFINIPIFKMIAHARKRDKGLAIAFFSIMVLSFFVDVLTTKFFWSAMILISVCCTANATKRLEGEK